MKKPLALVILSGFLITKANAEEAINTSATQIKPQKISALLLIDTSATLMEHSANSAGEGMSYSGFYRFDLGVPLSRTLTASMRMGYSQEYSYVLPNNSSGNPADIRLGLTQSWGEVRKDFTLEIGPRLYLPLSWESKRSGMKSAVGLSTFAKQKVGQFTFQLGPRFIQYFHDVEVQWDGVLNFERTLGVLTGIDYNLTDRWSLSLSFDPTFSWTYAQTASGGYTLAYEVGYEANEKLALSMGLSNKASALKSNGLEYNYTFFDQSQFVAYFDIALKL